MPDEENTAKGVLGNLPRSRPGRRSEKRVAATPKPRAKATPKPKPAARPKAAPAPKKPAASAPTPDPGAPEPPAGGPDPVGDVARTAAKAVGLGVRVGTGIAQEVLKRLPGR